ncbi:MAG TPA: MarR family transcriptional regulator [Acidimicrobiales bacterium]|nr:MarR family transcriptional regulator [Acidimicrobiales bacterium]
MPETGAPDTGAEAAEAWRLVYSLVLEGEAHTRLHEACRQVGLPVNLVKAMLTVGRLGQDREPPPSMRDLADHFNVDASYCTSLVDGLEANGLAERRAHPTDRRVKTVVLTDQGREVLARARALMDETPPAFLRLAPADQRRLRDLLAKVAAADSVLSAQRPSP